jgi:hypothetical protein
MEVYEAPESLASFDAEQLMGEAFGSLAGGSTCPLS